VEVYSCGNQENAEIERGLCGWLTVEWDDQSKSLDYPRAKPCVPPETLTRPTEDS